MKKCIDCLPHFKTRLITKKKLTTDILNQIERIVKRVKKKGQVQVYYCALGRLPQRVYLEGLTIYRLQACDYYCKKLNVY